MRAGHEYPARRRGLARRPRVTEGPTRCRPCQIRRGHFFAPLNSSPGKASKSDRTSNTPIPVRGGRDCPHGEAREPRCLASCKPLPFLWLLSEFVFTCLRVFLSRRSPPLLLPPQSAVFCWLFGSGIGQRLSTLPRHVPEDPERRRRSEGPMTWRSVGAVCPAGNHSLGGPFKPGLPG